MAASCELWMTGDGTRHSDAAGGWTADDICCALENGAIVFFPETPVTIPEADRRFLLGRRQAESGLHKNIAYRPAEDRVTGLESDSTTDRERLRAVLRTYSRAATAFARSFLAPYAPHVRLDYASFRPIEEEGRVLRQRARNDLLHVDSFPTRPTRGDRILRFFTNIHPTRDRVWMTSDPFEPLARRFADRMRPFVERDGLWRRLFTGFARRPAYDRWMLEFHHFLKENAEFQEGCRKARWAFPPNSAWLVYTDLVSHAVLGGQHALEQTFIIGQTGLVAPETAPINVLRRLYGVAPRRGPAPEAPAAEGGMA